MLLQRRLATRTAATAMIAIIRPYRPYYVQVRRCGLLFVSDRVVLSVGRSVTLMSTAKTAEPIEMPFEDSGGPTVLYSIRWGSRCQYEKG